MKQFRHILLAAFLLGGQFALLVHASDLEMHKADVGCEVCLHAVASDNGLLSTAVMVLPAAQAAICLAEKKQFESTARFQAFAARAPPFTFSA